MLKCIFVLIVLMGIDEIAISQYKLQGDLRLKESNVLYKEVQEFGQEEKSPLLAGFLSFIVPGMALGQQYNEQFVDAGIRIGISLLSIIWFSEAGHLLDVGGSKPGAWQVYVAGSIFAANWISSVPD